jgi:hypothetical protein
MFKIVIACIFVIGILVSIICLMEKAVRKLKYKK